MKSSCCGAEIYNAPSSTGSGNMWVCTKCNNPTNAIVAYTTKDAEEHHAAIRAKEAEVWVRYMAAILVKGYEPLEESAKEADKCLEEYRKRWGDGAKG